MVGSPTIGGGKSAASEEAQLKLEGAYLAAATVSEDWGDRDAVSASEHPGNDIEFEDYARELAFLLDLTEAASTTLDCTGPHVQHTSLSMEQQDRKDRRIPVRHLKQLYELLKGLLKAGLIAFSDSPWESPIVIVLKKNGVDIRLCIGYQMVNSVTAIMEYAMPLVDDLLTDMEEYLWYCSLDAASGFWAVMMTQRARKISAFICALGHFEWLRMPFGLKNAPMIYQRMIDNALWGLVQPRGGWSAFAERVRMAEAADAAVGGSPTDTATHGRTRFEADRESSDIPDSLSAVVNDPRGDMFARGEADQSSLVPVFERRSFADDICFGGESFESCLETLDRLLSRFEECRISVSFTKRMFVQPTVDFVSHAVSREGLRADAKKLKAITEFSFPRTKKGVQAFLGALNYYSRFIQDFAVYGAALYQVRGKDFGPGGDPSTAKRSFIALQAKVDDAPILRHFDRDKEVHVMLFANDWALSTTLMQEHDGVMHPVRFCRRVLNDNEVNYHPAEKEVLALLLLLKTCYTQLAGRTIHAYTRFSTLGWINTSKTLFGRPTQFAVMLSPWHLVVHRVNEDDSAFAQLLHSTITNFVGLDKALQRVAPPSKRNAMVRMDPALLYARLPNDHRSFVLSFDGSAKTPKHGGFITATTRQQTQTAKKRVRFADTHDEDSEALLVEPEPPDRPNDVTTESSHVENGEISPGAAERPPSAEDVDPLKVQEERRPTREAWKMADRFGLSNDGLLYFLGENRRWGKDRMNETVLRLVVPTTMVQKVLQSCHDSLEGGHQGIVRTFHRVKADYYWIGLYADVERHVRSCPDCSSSKSRPQLRGYSPGNILAERTPQIVSKDFVIPLPKSRRGNTALLLFQCAFTGFVMAKAMSNTSALCVAQAFEECVYSRFGAPSLVRHDRDPRFMSEIFQVFAEMMQSRSRATLSYRPQANGQQERLVKPVMQPVRVHHSERDTLLSDAWMGLLKAMASSLKRGFGRQSHALAWRREVNRQQEIALMMVKEYQAVEKARRASEHNDSLSKQEKASLPRLRVNKSSEGNPEDAEDTRTPVSESPKSLFELGDRVWLYMEIVKPGLTKKLAHRWHGPFRVKNKVDEYAYELGLPDRSGYRFYPVDHVSRLKAVREFGDRPKFWSTRELTDEARLDFDEELLPEDSWEPDMLAGEYEVESILDDRRPMETSTRRSVREFLVKWVGYDESTWEPMTNLSCGLLYDYLREKRSSQRFQMVQVADED
ncbi:unnamed protein product [Phytophthora fragariaefolia]|uniref:Unnamed protein product n=1 Tax=Phytophthora fragariaefolia TaxID=1490495 RepID=A0A9W6TRH9_9STRA|nr:unnamed protein product [Phytophthora fragariaefolia]